MNPMAAGSMAESGIIGSFISGKVMGGIQSKLAGGGEQPAAAAQENQQKRQQPISDQKPGIYGKVGGK